MPSANTGFEIAAISVSHPHSSVPLLPPPHPPTPFPPDLPALSPCRETPASSPSAPSPEAARHFDPRPAFARHTAPPTRAFDTRAARAPAAAAPLRRAPPFPPTGPSRTPQPTELLNPFRADEVHQAGRCSIALQRQSRRA